MKKIYINISQCPKELQVGIDEIRKEYPRKFGAAKSGYAVAFNKDTSLKEGGLEVERIKNGSSVSYGRKIDAFRALGRLLGEVSEARQKKGFGEIPKMTTLGIMIDASRNGVSTVDTVKALLRRMALMGINVCMMYTEDTYEVPGEPFFGYLRGRYTKQEMKGLDNYAYVFGIEMFPCIQTLGHLEQMLQWPVYRDYQDTNYIILAESKRTYALLEKMIKAATAPFRSKRIHVGMDEAHGLGQGRYKELKGEKRVFDIINTHLDRVRKICKKLGLRSMIWSDMYFRLGSKSHGYYDKSWSIPKDVVKDIPKDVQLVYWDYYHTDYSFYCDFIDKHRSLGSEPLVAPGVWTWSHFWAALYFAKSTITPCMKACRDKGIKEVILTAWGDDGMEVDIYSALPGLQFFAEYGYADKVSMKNVKANFRGSCDADFDAWMSAAKIDLPPELTFPETTHPNTSKYLLYEDVLIGMLEKEINRNAGLKKHYEDLAKKLFKDAAKSKPDSRLKFPAQLAQVISLKCCLRKELVTAYKKKNKAVLKKLIKGDLQQLRKEVDKLWKVHRDMWLSTYKPFGLEVLEMRYGALRTRLQSLAQRLNDYCMGRITSIPEFDTVIHRINKTKKGVIPDIGSYSRIISPSCIV